MSAAIRLEDVKKNFGGRQTLSGISFEVETGDMFGYLGSNGAGKTTTIRILLDLIKASSGSVSVMGEKADSGSIRRRIGFVLDADGLYNAMTARENLEFYASLYDVEKPGARIAKRLEEVGLSDRADDRVGTFSKGMRQRLALARSLVHDPDILILDEPMSGIDPEGQMQMRAILLDVIREDGKTIFFSSHDLDEVQRICNRIALIDRGEIKLYGELKALMREMGGNEIVIEAGGALGEPLAAQLAAAPELGFKGSDGSVLRFSPSPSVEVSDIVGFLVSRGAKVEGAKKREASLEELYASILKEREGSK
jgi:ABC-type multidrug transport system, ATPase component